MRPFRFGKLIAGLLSAAVLLLAASELIAQVRVSGYTRKDGTYVQPHYRSRPDGNFWNNWSTIGNVNPYTRKPGWKRTPPNGYGRGYRSRSAGSSLSIGAYSDNSDRNGSSSLRAQALQQKRQRRLEYRKPHYATDNLSDGGKADHEQEVNRLKAHGKRYNWRYYSPSELRDIAQRIEAAERIKRLGVDIEWYSETLPRLIYLEERLLAVAPAERQTLLASLR